jgi:hypothetical protein
MPRKDKRPPSRSPVPPRKEPPALPGWLRGLADGPAGSRPSWKLSRLDLEHAGSWSWDVTGSDLREIVQFLQQMERLTWSEIRAQTTGGRTGHRKHHSIEAERLCPEAQRRLRDLRLDDLDELFRFRLSGRRRLWGAINGQDGAFYALWWDPDHQVYPVDRD